LLFIAPDVNDLGKKSGQLTGAQKKAKQKAKKAAQKASRSFFARRAPTGFGAHTDGLLAKLLPDEVSLETFNSQYLERHSASAPAILAVRESAGEAADTAGAGRGDFVHGFGWDCEPKYQGGRAIYLSMPLRRGHALSTLCLAQYLNANPNITLV
jgi:hypothetical protein